MQTLTTVIHIVTSVLLVLVVLLQSGKGAEISASFGGSSQTVFGTSGGANFFTRFTAGLAATFMVTSIALTIMSAQSKKSVFDSLPAGAPVSQSPAAPAPAAAPVTAPTGATSNAPSSNAAAPATK